MEVIFASGVLEEVSASASYYEKEVKGLGSAFLQKLGDTLGEIKENPLAYRVIRNDFRRHLFVRFPYGIIYKINNDIIYVVAVMHLKRKPGYWIKRTE